MEVVTNQARRGRSPPSSTRSSASVSSPVSILEKITHFSIQKEIVDEHNTALAILMGAAIALAPIIGNVIR
ncbi:MAG: hypothetical protein R3C97_13380 [Geminicoccaceae bacterium]